MIVKQSSLQHILYYSKLYYFMFICVNWYCVVLCLYCIVLLHLLSCICCFMLLYCIDRFYIQSRRTNLTESIKQIRKLNYVLHYLYSKGQHSFIIF
jgi:1,4-dihydroxy-2-naphthoate octaprenyltransferase